MEQQPKLADTFYLASEAAFSKPGARITLRIELSEEILSAAPPVDPRRFGAALGDFARTSSGYRSSQVEDTSQNFSIGMNSSPPGGEITFTIPEQIEPGEVNGVTAYWVRVRIIKGNYGIPAHYEPVPDTPTDRVSICSGDFKPPILSRITLHYQADFPPVIN